MSITEIILYSVAAGIVFSLGVLLLEHVGNEIDDDRN